MKSAEAIAGEVVEAATVSSDKAYSNGEPTWSPPWFREEDIRVAATAAIRAAQAEAFEECAEIVASCDLTADDGRGKCMNA